MFFASLARNITPPALWVALSRLKNAMSSAQEVPLLQTVHGVTLMMSPKHALATYARTFPLYDTALPAFAAFVVNRLSRPISIIDVGANIGDTACLVAAATGRANARFICIEADDQYITLLRQNTAELDVEVIHAIAGKESTIVNLRATSTGAGTSAIISDALGKRAMISLNDITRGPVDILKIDTDGFELDVLDGASTTLQTTDAVFIEFSPRHLRKYGRCAPEHLLGRLRDHGFNGCTLAYDNFGVPIGMFREAELDAICRYVDRQQRSYLDLLFCRNQALLEDFSALELRRANSFILSGQYSPSD